MRVLDLFSGIGGFSLGLERAGMTTVAFCEINEARQVDLRQAFPGVPVFGDVTALTADQVGDVDIITGGFPCQDISTAGRRAGINGRRTGLFSEIIRLSRDLRPSIILLENSADLLTGADGAWARHVFGQLAEIGYDAEWHVIPASGLGAPHQRERVWIIATDPGGKVGKQRFELFLGRRFTRTEKAAAVVADHYCVRELQSGWCFTDKRGRVVYHPKQAWPETWVEKLKSLCDMDDGFPAGWPLKQHNSSETP